MKDKKFSKKNMKRLFNEGYMKEFFKDNLKNISVDPQKLEKVKIYPIKRHWSHKFVHIVCYYKLFFSGRKKSLDIIGAAHSDGSRKKLYKRQKYIYEHGFNKKNLRVPEPLFYFESLRVMFYLAAPGGNLYSRIVDKDYTTVSWAMPKIARWLAKFHNLEVPKGEFLENELTLKNIDPANILGKRKKLAKEYRSSLLELFARIKSYESAILKKPRRHSTIVHGDMHPENIIVHKKGNEREFVVIDFTEMRLAPPLYDIGSFIQQLESMSKGKFSMEKIHKLQQDFFDSYLEFSGEKATDEIYNQLFLYRAWVALRGAIFFIGAGKEHKIIEFAFETEENLKKIKL